MKRRLFLSCLGFAIVLGLTLPVSAQTLAPGDKIAPRVLAETQNGKTTEALVVLTEQADLRPAYSLQTKEEKGEFVVSTLREVANRTQAPILRMLDSLGVSLPVILHREHDQDYWWKQRHGAVGGARRCCSHRC